MMKKMYKYFEKVKIYISVFLKDPLFLRHWESSWYSSRRKDNQLSVRIRGGNGGIYQYYGHSSMFVDDMYMGIMPYMVFSGEREKYPIKIEPASREKEKLIADSLSNRGYSRFLGDGLCEFVRTTSHVLFQGGTAIYEIVYKKNERNEIESLDFELITPHYLFKFLGNYYQFVPWWKAKESRIKVQIIKIPKEKILQINFPKLLGGRRKIIRILKRLYYLGKDIVPEFHMEAMGKNQNIGFDFDKYNLGRYLEIATLTKDFGWNQRQLSGDNITEYYSMLRFLREKRVEAIMREEIIFSLNKALNRSPLNLGVKIIVENLKTLNQIREQEGLLKKGKVAFMDIFNALKL